MNDILICWIDFVRYTASLIAYVNDRYADRVVASVRLLDIIGTATRSKLKPVYLMVSQRSGLVTFMGRVWLLERTDKVRHIMFRTDMEI